jgi:hypothetical protein
MIYKPNCNTEIIPYEKYEENFIFEMIYKPNEKIEEKQKIMEQYKIRHFYLDDEKEYYENVLRLFGKYFVNKNKNKCKMIYKNKKYKLHEHFEEIEGKYNINPDNFNLVKLKIIFMNDYIDMSYMFYGCYHLTSLYKSPKKNSPSNITCPNDTLDEDDSGIFLLKEINILKSLNN